MKAEYVSDVYSVLCIVVFVFTCVSDFITLFVVCLCNVPCVIIYTYYCIYRTLYVGMRRI